MPPSLKAQFWGFLIRVSTWYFVGLHLLVNMHLSPSRSFNRRSELDSSGPWTG